MSTSHFDARTEQLAEQQYCLRQTAIAQHLGYRMRYSGQSRRGHQFSALSRDGAIIHGPAVPNKPRAFKALLIKLDLP